MKKYILLAAKYEYTKVRKGKKEKEKQEVSRFVYMDAVSHVMAKERSVSSVTLPPPSTRSDLRPARSCYRRLYPPVPRLAPSSRSNRSVGRGALQLKGYSHGSPGAYGGIP
jgi:hypothetical protein